MNEDVAIVRERGVWVEMPDLPNDESGDWLGSNGFTEFYKAEGGSLNLEVWIRQGMSPNFYIVIDNWSLCPGVYADTLPDAMEVLSMWMPVISHSVIADLYTRLVQPQTLAEATQYKPAHALDALVALIRKAEVGA